MALNNMQADWSFRYTHACCVLPVRWWATTKRQSHEHEQTQDPRAPLIPSDPHPSHHRPTGTCSPNLVSRSAPAISTTQQRMRDVKILQNAKKRATLSKSQVAAPWRLSRCLVLTLLAERISMPVRSHRQRVTGHDSSWQSSACLPWADRAAESVRAAAGQWFRLSWVRRFCWRCVCVCVPCTWTRAPTQHLFRAIFQFAGHHAPETGWIIC